jgi:DNA-binding MarR family transcriptional regulator
LTETHNIVSLLICQVTYLYTILNVLRLCYNQPVASLDLIDSLPLVAAAIPESLAEETGYLLRRAYVLAGERAEAAMPAGVSARHYQVLQSLADLGPRSQQQLAQLLWVNRTTMVALIDALESQGLVQRHRDPSDRRSYALQLTPAGRAHLSALSAAADGADAGLAACLAPPEATMLRAFLGTIAETVDGSSELPAGLAGRIAFLLGAAHHRVRERVNERLQSLELTTALYGVLATIAGRGPTSQQAVADELGLTGPAIVQTVDRLQALGLVERHRNPADRRSYALQPTGKGRETLRQVRETIATTHHDLEAVLGGPRARRELNRLLRALVEMG